MSNQGGRRGVPRAASTTPESPAGDRTPPPLQRIELLMIGDARSAFNRARGRDKQIKMVSFPCHRVPRTASSGNVYRSPDATGAGALVAGAGLLVIRHVLSMTPPAETPRRGRGPGRR